MTPSDELRELFDRLSELALDENLSDEDATVIVAGLIGVMRTMQDNPGWRRVLQHRRPHLQPVRFAGTYSGHSTGAEVSGRGKNPDRIAIEIERRSRCPATGRGAGARRGSGR